MNENPTWEDIARDLKIGNRVRFVQPWDMYPNTRDIEMGEQATVVSNELYNEGDHVLRLMPDDESVRADLAEWNGEIHLYGPGHGNSDAQWHEAAPVAKI